MPSGDHCCVPCCTNRRAKRPDLSFHTFPQGTAMRKRWTHAIRRDEGENFRITTNTVVCSEHFVDSSFLPSVHVVEGSSHTPRRRRLRKDAVPSVFSFGPAPVRPRPSFADRLASGALRARDMEEKKQRDIAAAAAAAAAAQTEGERKMRLELDQALQKIEESRKKIADLEHRVDSLVSQNAVLRSRVVSFENVKNDEEKLTHLTGLTLVQWQSLWEVLDVQTKADVLSAESASTEQQGRTNAPGAGREGQLTLEDQLLVTLMRLRLGWLQQELAYVFGVAESTISRIFRKWINFMYLRLGSLPLWPSWEDVQSSMCDCFRAHYPDTFIVLDATELRTEVPSSLALQSKLYSAYKSHTTLKGLVGISPNGSFTFISELWTGSISDRELVIQSGIIPLLEKIPPGKRVMADRGFDIQDLLVKPQLLLNIPSFKGSRPFLPLSEVIETQKIASVRIHIERAIGRVKQKFHILQKDIPLSMFGSINQVWLVCCVLTNFLRPLITNPDD